MSSPLGYFLIESLKPRIVRDIDVNYQVMLIADRAEEIRDLNREANRLNASAALERLRGTAEPGELTDPALSQMAAVSQSVCELTTEVEHRFEAVQISLDAIEMGLEQVAQELIQSRRVLETISETLGRPYESRSLELRRQADTWLRHGMRSSGRERSESWEDAMRLLRATIENPIGMQDYVAWFQIGWLRWKHEGNLEEAQQAFYRAQRLSAPAGDLYHVTSLRHLAHVHSLRGEADEAWEVLSKALEIDRDHRTLLDGARYASLIGQTSEMLELLSECLDQHPPAVISIIADDQLGPDQAILDLVTRKTREAESGSEAMQEELQDTSIKLTSIARRLGIPPPRPAGEEAGVIAAGAGDSKRGYLEAVAAWEAVRDSRDALLEKFRGVLVGLLSEVEAESTRFSWMREELERAAGRERSDQKRAHESHSSHPERRVTEFGWPLLARVFAGLGCPLSVLIWYLLSKAGVSVFSSGPKASFLEQCLVFVGLPILVMAVMAALGRKLEVIRAEREMRAGERENERAVKDIDDRLAGRLADLNQENERIQQRKREILSGLSYVNTELGLEPG